jgi:GntR family transcriptional regulator/MocR family aminotransferase
MTPRRSLTTGFQAFTLDAASSEPLHRQLYDEMRKAILTGRLQSGYRLPASRELATVMKLSRNTVLAAYDQLLAEGYIESRAGSGTFVAQMIPDAMVPEPPAPMTSGPARGHGRPRQLSKRGRAIDAAPLTRTSATLRGNAFRPGLPALDHFPMDVYRRLMDRRLRRASTTMLAYGDPQGYLPLREAIATHLIASRGARCTAEQIIITSGSQQAMDLAVRVLLDPGDTVWMEDPGYFAARAVLRASEANIVPVPVDREGMNVAAGIARAADARFVYCTPSHQNPLGVTLSLPRRLGLLQWAERSGAWIFEDDNASEYRFEGRPLAALQGVDEHARVLYAGTFSKVLFAGLRLGYLVAPTDLVQPLVRARALSDRQSPGIAQAVIADFMTEGHFARHIRRMRTLYAVRLGALLRAVRQYGAGMLEVVEGEGSTNRVVWLPEGLDDQAVHRRLAEKGILTLALSEDMIEPQPRGGLILGFGGVDEKEIDDGVRIIAETVREMLGERG